MSSSDYEDQIGDGIVCRLQGYIAEEIVVPRNEVTTVSATVKGSVDCTVALV